MNNTVIGYKTSLGGVLYFFKEEMSKEAVNVFSTAGIKQEHGYFYLHSESKELERIFNTLLIIEHNIELMEIRGYELFSRSTRNGISKSHMITRDRWTL